MPFLEAYQKALGNNEYYEQVLSVISILDEPVIKAKRLHGERWYEIDDVQDLDIATTLFAESEDERVSLLGQGMAATGDIRNFWISAIWLTRIFRHRN